MGLICSGPSAGSMIGRAAAILIVIVIAVAFILGALVHAADFILYSILGAL